jgi:exodeoxyribonuclease VII large subunit
VLPFAPMGGPRTVSELTRDLQALVADRFDDVLVRGEITNWRPAASGHVYFSLKDAGAVLPAVIWRGQAGRLRFKVEDGMEVVAGGKIDVYAPHGKYQMIVASLDPVGAGAAALALAALRKRLAAEGLFDPLRKRPLPLLPRVVGIATSPTGQAIRDLLRNILRRFPRARVLLRPVRVQGETAAAEVAGAIADLNAAGADVIVVGRGGGSAEDLGAFNDEGVARAIAASAAPVVSAVGHEGDATVADDVADLRVSTPTAAAEAVVPLLDQLLRDLAVHRVRLDEGLRARLSLARERVDSLAGRHALRRPVDRVRDLAQRVDELRGRLDGAARRGAARQGERLAAAAGRVEGVSPLRVLARGYSVTTREGDPAPILDGAALRPGDRLRSRFARGEVRSEVLP